MIRAAFMLTGLISAVVLFAELLAAVMLWSRGHLTSETIREVRLALSHSSGGAATEPAEQKHSDESSAEEIRAERVKRVLEFDARELELQQLKRLTADSANQLISDRQTFDQLKDAFRTELRKLGEKTQSDTTEQARAVLLASPPEDAVARLMGLSLEECLDLMQGMPEKQIARILQAFEANPKTSARGLQIFQSLYRGAPTKPLIDQTLNQLDQGAAPPTR